MNLPNHILVPTDFSPCADEAFDYAIALAAKLSATVTVVHAYDDGASAHVLANAQAGLAAAMAKRQSSGVPIKPLLKGGNPLDTITEVAREIGAEMIVMGTHGRQGLARVLLGSVAERVVRTASCPVLTVAPSDPDAA